MVTVIHFTEVCWWVMRPETQGSKEVDTIRKGGRVEFGDKGNSVGFGT